MKSWCAGLALLLGACNSTGDWAKPGVEASTAAREYADCRDIAESMVKPESGVDQDILATRQAEIGRSSIARIGAENLRDETRDRVTSITASCMKAKGFANGRAASDQPRK